MYKILLLIPALMLSFSLPAQDFDAVEIKTTDLGDGIYMLQGMGGNIGVSIGDDGVFVIDTQFAPLVEKNLAAISAITDQQISYIVNTHWHGDHTGGNAGLSNRQALIMAHDNVRVRMSAEGPRQAAPEALPRLTYSDTSTYYLNNHEIHAIHPANAHTDGDTFIYFANIDLLHTGDLLFNGIYPFIDLGSGGTVDGYIAAQEKMLELVGQETRIIPGHGPMATRGDIEKSIAMLKEIQGRITGLVNEGKSLEQIKAEDPLADYNKIYSWNFITGDRMLETLYNDATN